MKELDFPTIMHKWLKKAKLRDGSHSLGLTAEGTFWYRGFSFGYMKENSVQMIWPATTKPHSFTNAAEEWFLADPRFFQKLRKGFRIGMTTVNGVSIKNLHQEQQARTKQ